MSSYQTVNVFRHQGVNKETNLIVPAFRCTQRKFLATTATWSFSSVPRSSTTRWEHGRSANSRTHSASLALGVGTCRLSCITTFHITALVLPLAPCNRRRLALTLDRPGRSDVARTHTHQRVSPLHSGHWNENTFAFYQLCSCSCANSICGWVQREWKWLTPGDGRPHSYPHGSGLFEKQTRLRQVGAE